MKRLLIILFTIILLFVSSCTHSNHKTANHHQTHSENMKSNTTDSLKVRSSQIVTIVDVRTPEEFAEGNIEGSVNVPLDLLEDSLDPLKEFDSIVVVCRSGNRSAQAKKILNKNGFANVTDGKAWDTFSK